MTNRLPPYLIVGTLVAALATPACYTLINHPKVMQGQLYVAVDDDRCANCHDDSEIWSFNHPSNRVANTAPGWRDYYAVPWWYASKWHYTPPEPDRKAATPTQEPVAGTNGSTGSPPKLEASRGNEDKATTSDVSEGPGDDSASKKRTVDTEKNKKDESR